jgi:hypothetical protein
MGVANPQPLQPLIASKNLSDLARTSTALANLGIPTSTSWTALTLVNGWSNVGGGNPPAQVSRTLNLVSIEASITGGTGTEIAVVPAGNLPANTLVIPMLYFVSPNFLVGIVSLLPSGVLSVTTLAGALPPAGCEVFFTITYPTN